jgi:hypothetical protein
MSKQASKTSLSQMLPTSEREREMMNFWYAKGYAEAERMAAVNKNKRKVRIIITGKKKFRAPHDE